MLTSLRIQNFRSIRDASVKLGQVNLFIGPNNSGKSNFLKGITMLGAYLKTFPRNKIITEDQFQTLLPRQSTFTAREELIRFIARVSSNDQQSISLILGYAYDHRDYNYDSKGKFAVDLTVVSNKNIEHNFGDYFEQEGYSSEEEVPTVIWESQKLFVNLKLYKFEPAAFLFSTELSNQPFLDANGRNITAFLYTLSQNHEDNFARLRTDFAQCVVSLSSFSTPPDPATNGNLRLKFFDAARCSYWAEEVSEGVLYFLAILCIVHQPDPPKLLLLEEPEKGIHPRRIKEVMDFIFELARLRDIQIILTSHSPYVVDYFADIPECISVFDRENGETVIHNAGDIISETNDKLKAAGQEPIHYTDALGEYWVSGFLGGVPV
ncbi:AAA family ATPase [Hymenobacter nivis]|uniref:ATPase AAA-type core domain-containing protein n=1 Tax=Hymenobacter nivis TaxID=1850093 RepID=A0A2Z3GX19_9BACT|nr:AAA family ATPase [Hymenobacter nivis]AWM33904.1 hypothetical protein DDQ68_14555 [Hymenobacter nivis]